MHTARHVLPCVFVYLCFCVYCRIIVYCVFVYFITIFLHKYISASAQMPTAHDVLHLAEATPGNLQEEETQKN